MGCFWFGIFLLLTLNLVTLSSGRPDKNEVEQVRGGAGRHSESLYLILNDFKELDEEVRALKRTLSKS